MFRPPPRSTRTDTLFPYTRSSDLRQWTLHPAFQLLPVELAVVVVVDGVELGGQRGVRLRFAAADAAVAVAVHRGEVDLVVADDRVGRARGEGHQRQIGRAHV